MLRDVSVNRRPSRMDNPGLDCTEYCVVTCGVTLKRTETVRGRVCDCAQFCAHHQTLRSTTSRRCIAGKPCWQGICGTWWQFVVLRASC